MDIRMDIQQVRRYSLPTDESGSTTILGNNRIHSFKKMLTEKNSISSKDVYIKGEVIDRKGLSELQKGELRKKYNIADMGYYSDEADELFGTLRDLGVITENEYLRTGQGNKILVVPGRPEYQDYPPKFGLEDEEPNLFAAYRSIAARQSQDYADLPNDTSKADAEFNKHMAQVLYDVFMS